MIIGSDMSQQEHEEVNKVGLERKASKQRMNRRLDRIANMSVLEYFQLKASRP